MYQKCLQAYYQTRNYIIKSLMIFYFSSNHSTAPYQGRFQQFWTTVCYATSFTINCLICDFCPSEQSLPPTSIRLHLTMDLLMFGYVFPTTKAHSILSLVSVCSCWAHTEKSQYHQQILALTTVICSLTHLKIRQHQYNDKLYHLNC